MTMACGYNPPGISDSNIYLSLKICSYCEYTYFPLTRNVKIRWKPELGKNVTDRHTEPSYYIYIYIYIYIMVTMMHDRLCITYP